jgi:hypothetical protein
MIYPETQIQLPVIGLYEELAGQVLKIPLTL